MQHIITIFQDGDDTKWLFSKVLGLLESLKSVKCPTYWEEEELNS